MIDEVFIMHVLHLAYLTTELAAMIAEVDVMCTFQLSYLTAELLQ